MNCKCVLVPAFSESKWFRYSEVIRLGGHIWVTDAHLAAKQLWHQSNRESAWMLRYLEVFREQVNCCLPAFMSMPSAVVCYMWELCWWRGCWMKAGLSGCMPRASGFWRSWQRRLQCRGLCTHSKSHTGPQPMCDRAEEDGASTASESSQHWSVDTFAGGFVQAVLIKACWMNK